MKLDNTRIALSLFVAASSWACQQPDIGSEVLEERNCPSGECEPPDPPEDDPPPPPPPPPPQPDPAKFRQRFIPMSFVSTKLDTVLGGTTLQVSHTDGTLKTFHYTGQECEIQSSPELQECIAECNALDLPPPQRAECRRYCNDAATTCEEVCSATQLRSWLRWGPAARLVSAINDPKPCDANTCPACNPPQSVPSLEDRPLLIPAFDRVYELPLVTYHIRCVVNRWVFQIGGNITIGATPAGLTLSVPGSTGDPAIPCDNAPDVEVDGLALQITFLFPSVGLNIGAEGTLLGDWDVFGEPIEFLADLNDRVTSGVRDASRDALNTPSARAAYRSAFTTLVGQFVQEVTNERLDILSNIQSTHGGLNVRYWVR